MFGKQNTQATRPGSFLIVCKNTFPFPSEPSLAAFFKFRFLLTVEGVGEERNSPFPILSLWAGGKMNKRQIDKRKSSLISCAQEPYIHERFRDRKGQWVYKAF